MMEQVLSIEAAAAVTGESQRRLNYWCATGRLRCEIDDSGWSIAPAELTKVPTLSKRVGRAEPGRHAVALIVPSGGPDGLPTEVARRMKLDRAAISTATMVIDGTSYAALTWPHIGRQEAADGLADLASDLGGDVVDVYESRGQPGNAVASTP